MWAGEPTMVAGAAQPLITVFSMSRASLPHDNGMQCHRGAGERFLQQQHWLVLQPAEAAARAVEAPVLPMTGQW